MSLSLHVLPAAVLYTLKKKIVGPCSRIHRKFHVMQHPKEFIFLGYSSGELVFLASF